jgi:hypothetical protein
LRTKIKEFYVIEKAAMILYGLGVIGFAVFAVQGEWVRAGVTLLLVLSLWVWAMVRAIRAGQDYDRARANYERQIATRSRIERPPAERMRRRGHQ